MVVLVRRSMGVLAVVAAACGSASDLGDARSTPGDHTGGIWGFGDSSGGHAAGGAPAGGSGTGGLATAGGAPSAGGATGGAPAQTGGNGPACTAEPMDVRAPAVLEFVVDVSGSMAERAYPTDPNNVATKLDEVKRLLPPALASLPSDWAVGIEFFSYTDGSGCYQGRQAVAIAPLGTNLAAIDSALAGATAHDYAPTAAAWLFGLLQVEAYTDPPYANSPRAIVLVTDGVPSVGNDGCAVSEPFSQAEYDVFIDEVMQQSQLGGPETSTFVVGVPGSDDPQGATYDPMYELSLLAIAGGTGEAGCTPKPGVPSGNTVSPRGTYCHVDMTADPDMFTSLTAALQTIATQPVSCSYSIPSLPGGRQFDPVSFVVTYHPSNGATVNLNRATSSACTDGQWYAILDSSGASIGLDLCPDTCQALTSDPGAQIGIALSCVLLP